MAKIGVIYCSYGMPELLSQSLSGWVKAKKENTGGNDYVIVAVSCPFVEYKGYQTEDKTTKELLELELSYSNIDEIISGVEGLKEHEVRDLALQKLLSANCDIICLADGDEFFTVEQILGIFNFIKLDRFTSWFRFSYRNYVFDDKHYLRDTFTPPRLFRVETNGYRLNRFRWDNDMVYKGTVVANSRFVEKEIDYTQLPSRIIPSGVALIKHFSWLSNERTKRKIEYQMKHFNGLCSFFWNNDKNKLEFNKSYYNNIGQTIPEILEDV